MYLFLQLHDGELKIKRWLCMYVPSTVLKNFMTFAGIFECQLRHFGMLPYLYPVIFFLHESNVMGAVKHGQIVTLIGKGS